MASLSPLTAESAVGEFGHPS